ncbi:ShlB/FhaC/HecB family hemolysin secretion/activation protein [Cyanobacteria bacterium FACHB-DQ100]|nr:ShlB/FhaC/HecB family hemolysin secretion/activation protein [Cyanobacteria bacterium FACHB-DQ100]
MEKKAHFVIVVAIALSSSNNIATAQNSPSPVSIPPIVPNIIEQTISKPTEPFPSTPPAPIDSLPQPLLQIPTLSQSKTPANSDLRFKARKIEVVGNTILKEEIANLILTYENREITFDDLIALRSAITQLYIKSGYVTSGAYLPNNQVLDQGIVKIQVIEGVLERIEISGLRRLHDHYVRKRLELAVSAPLNQQKLERALQLLQLNPLIVRVNAELSAGSVPGRNVLRVQLLEAPALHIGFGLDNHQSPSIGSLQGSVLVNHDNLLGLGDRFNAEYGRTEGLNLYDLSYSVPISANDATIALRYGNNSSRITDEIFRDYGIRSKTRTFAISFRQPIVRTPQTEFALGLSLDLRRSQTFLLDDIPFSFSEGAETGESKVTVLRVSQDWVSRAPNRVLAARSQFSFGINALGATVNETGTDGRFFSWLGQFQWVQQLSPRVLLLTRTAAQITPGSLLSLERFSLGGVGTVRGYGQNQLVTDNGVLGSIELRLPLTKDPSVLQIAPFFDIGKGWNRKATDLDSLLMGIGVGLEWNPSSSVNVRIDYGIPLKSVSGRGNSLQENGLYFSVRYQPF